MRQSLELVKRLYTVRSCHYDLPKEVPARPCLDYHIGRCKAPCVAFQTPDEYRGMIDEITEVLGGHTRLVARAAAGGDAEGGGGDELRARRRAARRHRASWSRWSAASRCMDVTGSDRDIVGFARDGAEACGVVLRIREGKLLGREAHSSTTWRTRATRRRCPTFATRVYADRAVARPGSMPREVFFGLDFEDRPVLEELLRAQARRAVRLQVPQRGEKVQLVELADQNARHLLEERKLMGNTAAERAPDALYELQEVLELTQVPRTDGVLRHFAHAGDGGGGVRRVLRERASRPRASTAR